MSIQDELILKLIHLELVKLNENLVCLTEGVNVIAVAVTLLDDTVEDISGILAAGLDVSVSELEGGEYESDS